MSKTNIYVLLLEKKKYYVGKSDNVERRFQEHLNGQHGSAWTHKYKPILIEKVFKNVSVFEEDRITKEYMSKYGIDNVRGGTYVEINLSDEQKDVIQKEIWAAKDLCTNCGRDNHFVNICHAATDINGNRLVYDDDEDEEEDEEEDDESDNDNIVCYRCGRPGHKSPDCYAKTHIDGRVLK